jgi:hypothetical protein
MERHVIDEDVAFLLLRDQRASPTGLFPDTARDPMSFAAACGVQRSWSSHGTGVQKAPGNVDKKTTR